MTKQTPTGEEELNWKDSFKLELNQWMKRLASFRHITIAPGNRGFTVFEAPELEEFIQSKVIPPEQAQAKREVIEKVRSIPWIKNRLEKKGYERIYRETWAEHMDELEKEADGE